MASPISTLPTNPMNKPTPQDIELLNNIFGEQSVDRNALSSSLRQPLIVAFIVGLMVSPFGDEMIERFTDNKYSKIAIKVAISAVLFFVINNWSLARQ